MLGAVNTLTDEGGRTLGKADLELAEDLGHRASLAVDGAALSRSARSGCAREEVTALLDTLLEKAPVGFAFFNNDLRFLRINEELSRIDGLPPHEHWGRRVSEVLPNMPPTMEQYLEQVKQTGQPLQNIELVGNTSRSGRDRRDLLISFYPVRAEGTKLLGIGAVIVDITERNRAEAAIRTAQERLKAALEASGTGTFRWNIRANEMDWDENLDRLLGFDAAALRRGLDQFIDIVHPDDRANFIAHCEQSARAGDDLDLDFRVMWPDGSIHWLTDRGKTYFDATGNPLYMAGACVDITWRKAGEQALRESESALPRAHQCGSAHRVDGRA